MAPELYTFSQDGFIRENYDRVLISAGFHAPGFSNFRCVKIFLKMIRKNDNIKAPLLNQ